MALSDRPKCLATWAGATPARRAARTALRCPSCKGDGTFLDLEGLCCLTGSGTRLFSNRLACLAAASNSGRPPLPFFSRLCTSTRSWPNCWASWASDKLASSGSPAGTEVDTRCGVGMVSVYSNRSSGRGEDPLGGIASIWGLTCSVPSFKSPAHCRVSPTTTARSGTSSRRWRDSTAGGGGWQARLHCRQEVVHRRHPALLKVPGVAPALDPDEPLRLRCGRIQPLAKGKRDGTIRRAVPCRAGSGSARLPSG